MENAKGKFPLDFSTYQAVYPDDFVFCFFDVDETPRTVGLSSITGMITGAYTVLYTKDINKIYLYYFYLCLDDKKGLRPLYRGLRKTVPFDSFMASRIPVPSPEEQQQIARYLDWKTCKINKFIERKKKFWLLLKEQTEFLAYGEKDNSCIKTCADWKSLFPEHWEFKKARRIFSESVIKNTKGKELLAVTQDRGILLKSMCTQKYVSPAGSYAALKLVKKDNFVISLRSFQGGIEFSEYEGIVSPAYTVMMLKREYSDNRLLIFYRVLFKSSNFIRLLNTIISGVRDGKSISFSDFSELEIPLPPLSELGEILVSFQEYMKIKKLAGREIELIQEYRARLVSDVVTGKVDVRSVEIPKFSFRQMLEWEFDKRLEGVEDMIEEEGIVE